MEVKAYLKAMGQAVPESHPELVLNPSNSIIQKLAVLQTENPELAKLLADQVVNTSLLLAGMLDDPSTLANSSQKLLEKLLHE